MYLINFHRNSDHRPLFVLITCLIFVEALNNAIARKHHDRTRHHKTPQRTEEDNAPTTTDEKLTLSAQEIEVNGLNRSTTAGISFGQSIVITTTQGKIQGEVVQALPNLNIARFLGIPYGRPPVESFRFKKPVPALSWDGVRDATHYSASCYQWRDDTFGEGYNGTEMWNANTPLSEDCLHVNVWSPVQKDALATSPPRRDVLLPVMVWIYGGGFYSGTASLDVYDGKWLASAEQVVVVSMNYRIAALGFLTLGDNDIPGNVGLWDQHLALLWVRENIRNFGGDPLKVTLFGESAGAASVSMHVISEHSKGLFRNVILESASALSPWAILSQNEMKRRAIQLAKGVGCLDDKNSTESDRSAVEEIVTCLQLVDPQKLVDVEMGMEDFGTARFPNAAVVDEDFLTADAVAKVRSGQFQTDINILSGFNGNEGNYFLVYSSPGFNITSNKPIDYAQYREGLARGLCADTRNDDGARFEDLPDILLDVINFEYTDFEDTLADKKLCSYKKTENACSNKYSEKIRNSYKDILDHIVGDTNFICPTIDFMSYLLLNNSMLLPTRSEVKAEFARGRKYLYQFAHRSTKTPWPEWMGVLHGYEIEFIFGIPLNKSLGYRREEVDLSRRTMRYWANFARTGDPNDQGHQPSALKDTEQLPYWPEFTLDNEASLIFDTAPKKRSENYMVAINYVQETTKSRHCSFWRSYYPGLRQKIDALLEKDYGCTIQEWQNSASATSAHSHLLWIFLLKAVIMQQLTNGV